MQKWRRIQGSVSLEDLGPGVTIGHDVPWSNSCSTGCIIVYGRCILYTVQCTKIYHSYQGILQFTKVSHSIFTTFCQSIPQFIKVSTIY